MPRRRAQKKEKQETKERRGGERRLEFSSSWSIHGSGSERENRELNMEGGRESNR